MLDDGGEVDLDLGNYERFLDVTLTRDNNLTTGKVYNKVITAEVRFSRPCDLGAKNVGGLCRTGRAGRVARGGSRSAGSAGRVAQGGWRRAGGAERVAQGGSRRAGRAGRVAQGELRRTGRAGWVAQLTRAACVPCW